MREPFAWRRQWGRKSKWDYPLRNYKVRRKKDIGWSFCKIVFSRIIRNGGKYMAVTVCTDTYMNTKLFPQLKVHSGSYSGLHDTFRIQGSFLKSYFVCTSIISCLILKVLFRMLSSFSLIKQHLVQCFGPNQKIRGQSPGELSIIWVPELRAKK